MNIVVAADTTGWAPRDCRYSAVDDDTWDGAPDSCNRATVGYGATPAAAIADLMALLADELSIDTDWLRERSTVARNPFPAHAGMTRSDAEGVAHARQVPCARGDDMALLRSEPHD